MVDENLQQSAEQKKSRGSFWHGLGILLTGLSIVVLISVLGFAGYRFFMVNESVSRLVGNLASQSEESQLELQKTQKAIVDLQQTVQQMGDALKQQGQSVAELQQNVHNGKDDLAVAEAEFLVKMANDNLQFENNIPLAIRLLETADQNLAKLADPRLYPVREAFAADLAALRNAPQVDLSGLYLRLSTLSDQLDTLPVVTQFTIDQAKNNSITVDQNLPWWKRGLHSTWQALGQIVVVRKKQMTTPFIAPDQQAFLYENLRSEVEKAEWGLLHHKPEVYQTSLNHVADWIKKYALQTSPVTQQLLASVTQLQAVDIRPANTGVTGSLQALQNYFNAVGK
jgi:uroporphyrin-III C-methyltransferase